MLIQFVQNSGVAAGLIAVILLLRRVRRLPSGCLDALWIAALVRLFIPFNLPSPFSIYRLLAHTPQPDTLSTSLTQSTVFAVNPLSPTSIFGVVWAIGAVFALTHLALSYLRLLHICRNAQPVCDPSILQAVQDAGLRRPVSVRTHPSITVPCTFGIMRSVILLPVDLEAQEDASMPYLLAHELAHIRRLDCLRKLLFQVVRCVHWFNPLVWLMCRAAGRDLERACDTTVLDTLSRRSARCLCRCSAQPCPCPAHCAPVQHVRNQRPRRKDLFYYDIQKTFYDQRPDDRCRCNDHHLGFRHQCSRAESSCRLPNGNRCGKQRDF